MILYLTWIIFIDLKFWPQEAIDIWRSRSSEVKKGSQNGRETPKNL